MTGEKVLIIEDDPMTRRSLERVISKEGYDVIAATDGYEGLNLFRSERPSVVITDLKMPKIDGMEIMYTVKHLAPETEVILITGHGDYDTAILALRQGALDYLKKPVDLDKLILSLGRAQEKIREKNRIQVQTTIMILEDDEKALENLDKIFKKEDYRTFTGADGEEGMKIFNEHKIDIALVDIEMPKKGGMEVLHDIREITEDCEVIVLTGYGDENTAIQALHEGAINYIRKPVDVDQVLLSVQKAAERLELRRSLLYKARELELAHEIIATFTEHKDLIIELGQNLQINPSELANEFLDILPLPFLLFDEECRIVFGNRLVSNICGKSPLEINEEVLRCLGLQEMGAERLKELITKTFSGEIQDRKEFPILKNQNLVLMKVILVIHKNEKVIRVLAMIGKAE